MTITYDRIRRLDADAWVLLLGYAAERFGRTVLDRAWTQSPFYDGKHFNPRDPSLDFFERWFAFSWKPERGKSLPELFLQERGRSLLPEMRMFMEEVVRAPYSFYQVAGAEPGAAIECRDVLRREDILVTERTGSATLERGMILFARIATMGEINFLMGHGPYPLPPLYLAPIVSLRESLEKLAGHTGIPLSTALLRKEEDACRRLYLDLMDQALHPMQDIRNTDGDPLAWHTLTYRISSLEETVDALKELELRATGRDDRELFAGARWTKSGRLSEVTIHWLKRSPGSGGGETSMGTLTVGRTRLIVEVNSEKRAKRIQKEIQQRMGEDAALLRTTVRTQEELSRPRSGRKNAPVSGVGPDQGVPPEISPEMQAFVREMLERHWREWLDHPVPALRGMTPRQAAKDAAGRELLESLLIDFEGRNARMQREEGRVDVAKLRQELGMDSPG